MALLICGPSTIEIELLHEYMTKIVQDNCGVLDTVRVAIVMEGTLVEKLGIRELAAAVVGYRQGHDGGGDPGTVRLGGTFVNLKAGLVVIHRRRDISQVEEVAPQEVVAIGDPSIALTKEGLA